MTSPEQKKWRLFRTYLARYPLWCAWQVTYRCDFRCRFCHYWFDEMGKQPEQTLEQFEEGSARLARLGTMLISLAGGEPFLREDIVDIVRAVGRWHFPFITTNGYHADKHLARELFAAGLWGVSISIDYDDAEKHDQARGIEGAFDRAVESLRIFSEARKYPWQRVNLMSVLLDDNLDQMEPLIQLAAQHNAYFMVQPYGILKTGNKRFHYRQTNDVGQFLLKLRRKYPNFLSNPHFLSRFDAALNGGVPNCAAGRAFFNIDSVGGIARCVEFRPQPVGNLYQDNIITIINKLRQDSAANRCQKCWYNCRGEVESLYHISGLIKSLPTLFFDRGRPGQKNDPTFSLKSAKNNAISS